MKIYEIFIILFCFLILIILILFTNSLSLYNFSNSPIDDGFLSAKSYVAKYHQTNEIDSVNANTWYNLTWNLNIIGESTEGISLNSDNETFTINNSGIYRVQGCVHPVNNGVGIQTSNLYVRTLVNGLEARCLQATRSKGFKEEEMDTLFFIGTINVSSNSKVWIQYQVTNNNIDFKGSDIFDNPVSFSVNFEKISNLP